MAVKKYTSYLFLLAGILLLGGMFFPPSGLGADEPSRATIVPLPPAEDPQPPPKHPDVQAAEDRYNSLTWSDVNAKNRQDDPNLYYFYGVPAGKSGQAVFVTQPTPTSQNAPTGVVVTQQEKS